MTTKILKHFKFEKIVSKKFETNKQTVNHHSNVRYSQVNQVSGCGEYDRSKLERVRDQSTHVAIETEVIGKIEAQSTTDEVQLHREIEDKC